MRILTCKNTPRGDRQNGLQPSSLPKDLLTKANGIEVQSRTGENFGASATRYRPRPWVQRPRVRDRQAGSSCTSHPCRSREVSPVLGKNDVLPDRLRAPGVSRRTVAHSRPAHAEHFADRNAEGRTVEPIGRARAPTAGLALLALISPARAIIWLLAGSFLWCLTMVIYNVLNAGLAAQFTPAQLMGRVGATRRTLTTGVVPIGSLTGGLLGDLVGIPAAVTTWIIMNAIGATLATTTPSPAPPPQPTNSRVRLGAAPHAARLRPGRSVRHR